jgi:hypothetical protein
LTATQGISAQAYMARYPERDYAETLLPSKELRLLGLFRFWNIIVSSCIIWISQRVEFLLSIQVTAGERLGRCVDGIHSKTGKCQSSFGLCFDCCRVGGAVQR